MKSPDVLPPKNPGLCAWRAPANGPQITLDWQLVQLERMRERYPNNRATQASYDAFFAVREANRR